MNRTRELGTEPIGKLLRQYAVPAIIAMVASSLYNWVDTIFIGHLGEGVGASSITALGIVFPLMNISTAIGSMVGVGASTMISVRLGQKNHAEAQQYFGNAVTLKLLTGFIFGALSLIFLVPILRLFGASDEVLPYACEYMKWILYGNVFTHLYFGLNGILRSAGHPRKAMYATIITVVLNAILDPIFIFALGMGLKGAAIATVLAQMVCLVWQVSIFRDPECVVHFQQGIYRLRGRIVKGIFAIGLSPFLMHVCSCLVVLVLNRGMLAYGGDMAVGAYSLVNKTMFLFAMFVMGLNQGMQPIAGYNYGAGFMPRVHEVLRRAIFFATICMTIAWLLAELVPQFMLRIFTDDPALLAHAVPGMRIFSAVFPVVGFQMVTSNYFQSIGQATKSIYLSLSRQLIFLIPGLLLFPLLWGLDGVWIAIPVSDGVATVNAAVLLWLHVKGSRGKGQGSAADGSRLRTRLRRHHWRKISHMHVDEENWSSF